ncbi:MAG: three-Cys-motif partner protein TcmP, partial [Terriglobia bacterium]
MRETSSIQPKPDGLPTPEVGAWAETKYRLVALYDRLFSTGMKAKWDTRVYVDLYAGAGYAQIRGTNRIIHGSPLLALDVPDPFDKYIFCEANSAFLQALEYRIARLFSGANVQLILGDCNDKIDEMHAAIPKSSKRHTVLSFCFVDPFNIGIKFATVRKLASHRMDFLVLLALYMDANRNVAHYTSPENSKVDEFLGTNAWRQRWQDEQRKGTDFPPFLAQEYARQMEALGYLPRPMYEMKEVRSDEKNLPLYHLALFS